MANPTIHHPRKTSASGPHRAASRRALLLAILAFAIPIQNSALGSASEPVLESSPSVSATDDRAEDESSQHELIVNDDPAAIFQKAFWRRPHPDDRIVHAERREWLDTDGNILRWQWFLLVEPSEPTLDWLASNPFLLSPAAAKILLPTGPTAPPEWFPAQFSPDAALSDATGQHVLALSPNGTRLYATDSGNGFAR